MLWIHIEVICKLDKGNKSVHKENINTKVKWNSKPCKIFIKVLMLNKINKEKLFKQQTFLKSY